VLRFAGFPLTAWTFALRTWAAMMLALFAAFWLQLDNAAFAAVTVGILSLQTRGQAYQKAVYRLAMTAVGVVVSIVIAGLFAQARDLLVIAYASWLGLCVYAGGLLDGNREAGLPALCVASRGDGTQCFRFHSEMAFLHLEQPLILLHQAFLGCTQRA
jgi:hypothetical protein